MLRSDICDFGDAYIVVKRYIAVTNPDDAKRDKSVAFKNNVPFINCILKINGVQIDNADNLDAVIPTYNLLEYSKNYRKTAGSLWNYYRDEPSNPLPSNSEYFKYKTRITGNIYDLVDGEGSYNTTKFGKYETKIVVSLTLKRLGGQFDPLPPVVFQKTVFSKERVKPWFFVTFNVIIRHIFSENFIKIPQVV